MTDERDRPVSETGPTVPPSSATDETLAAPISGGAPASRDTVNDETIVPVPELVRLAAGDMPSSRGSALRSKGDSQARSIGEEMQSATIEQFGMVGHDRFEVLDELARGGLGRVFRARDPRTNRIVAIKEVLRPQADIIVRFAREALVTANLQHPAIVPVYEVGRWDTGEPFYAMKLVQGRTLDDLITEAKTLDARIALVPHLIDVADALAYAHSERVIHRDLKPANVLVGAYGETVVIDWGLAKNLATGEELDTLPHATTIPPDNAQTVIGSVVGTPAYMPPEQAIGEKVDEHADVYAIGAILYHVLTGVRPYRAARTIDELLRMVSTERPQPISELVEDAPPELVAIVEKAMARRPEDRYATAQGLALDLRAFQAGKLVAAHRYTARQLVRRWIGKHKGMVLTAAVALGVLITIGAIGVWRIAKERDLARSERAEAQRQRTIAVKRVADSLEELARQAMIAKAPDKALPLLEGAVAARAGIALTDVEGSTRNVAGATPTLDILVNIARAAYAGLVGVVPRHARGTTGAALAHDGAWVISTSTDGDLRAWDLIAGKAVWQLHAARLMALSPDQTSVLGVDDTGRLAVIAIADGKLLHEWRPDAKASTDIAGVLAWSPDGAHFAAGTQAGRVFLGAPASSTLASLDPHQGTVWAVAFSPDGTRFATAGKDGVTIIRDSATGATLVQLADGATEIASITWLDSTRLITGDDQGRARVWDVPAKRIVRTITQKGAIYGVLAGTTEPRWIATFGDSTEATVWSLDTGTVHATLSGHSIGIDLAALVGNYLVTTDETGNAFVWDPMTGERLQAIPNEGTLSGVTALGDRMVLFGDGRVRVWRIAPDLGVQRAQGHTARIRDLAWSPDGRIVWSASHDGTARGFELATGKTTVLGVPSGFTEPAITALPDGGTPAPPVNPHGLRSLRVSPDGKWIATAAEHGALVLWDAADPTHSMSLFGHTGRVRRMVFAADQRTAYSVGDHTLRAWDLLTGRQRGVADLGESAWDVVLFGDVIATQDEGKPNKVALWSVADLHPIAAPGLTTRFYELFAANDHLLVGNASEVDVIDVTGKPSGQFGFATGNSASIAGSSVAVAGVAGDIALFDWPGLHPIRSWQSGAFITTMRFRPDGAILATVGDKRVRLWDPFAGRLLAELELPVILAQLAWSPDGTHLAVAGGSGTVWIWNLTPADPSSLSAYIKCASPWQLADTAIVAAPFDPASCSVLAR